MPSTVTGGSRRSLAEQLALLTHIVHELKLLRSGQILSGMAVAIDESIVD